MLEDLLLEKAPLAISFDVSPFLDQYYFNEFTYYDVVGGMLLSTLSPECNAYVMEKSINDVIDVDYTLVDKLTSNIGDKYNLNSMSKEYSNSPVIFMPGTNLVHATDRNLIDRIMFNYPDAMIKPHPLTKDDTLASYGRNYGYNRVFNRSTSGLSLLKSCSNAYISSNSEFGIIAAALKKSFTDMTLMPTQPRLSYSPLYRLFKDNNPDHNYEILARALSSKKSGFIFPWMEDYSSRIDEYYKFSMEYREIYKPRFAGTIYRMAFINTDPALRGK